MLPDIPRISALIICYKQEELIKRAIESLLSQKDYLYEICVSDDCSPDNTWEVLQDYDKKYPGLFKLHRNDPNIGIFENEEQVNKLPTGDIVYRLAGDDACGEGWFKKVVEFIQENNIDYKNELFCIYGDYKAAHPNGTETVYSNKAILSGINPVRLALRWAIGNRSSCYSINVLKKFDKVSYGRSHRAETAQDRQLQLFAEKNYYIPYVGNIYYTSVGISTTVKHNEELFKDRLEIMPYAEAYLKKHGFEFKGRDKYLTKYVQALDTYRQYHSLKSKLRLIYYRGISFDKDIDKRIFPLRYILFILRH